MEYIEVLYFVKTALYWAVTTLSEKEYILKNILILSVLYPTAQGKLAAL